MGNVQGPILCVGGTECTEYQAEDISILCSDDRTYVNAMPLPGLTPLTVWEAVGENEEEPLLKLIAAVREDDPPRVLKLFVDGMGMDDMRKALSLAAKYGSVNVTRELVGIGCSAQFVDSTYNVTPLHLAACGGHPDICDILLDALADANCECDGLTALSYARRLGNVEVQEVIEKHIAHPPHSETPRESSNKRHLVLPRVSALLTEAVLLWDFSNEKKEAPPSANSIDDTKSDFSYRSDTELISNVSTSLVNDRSHTPSSGSPQTSADSGSEPDTERSRSDPERKQDLAEGSADQEDSKDEVSPAENSPDMHDGNDEATKPPRPNQGSAQNEPVVDQSI
eukprot:TRINITY_DN8272_c0_g1_i1.p1 TRINITY_DN8272_c0_g1~~TRINITY_DN8272_c0_g1_i1.p1  ORF type:complete len:340 (+),score=59.54 TRINITY_DN8272_c0_g1_i1:113-1132(+)